MNRIANVSRFRERVAAAGAEVEHASRRQPDSLGGPQDFDSLAADPIIDGTPSKRGSCEIRNILAVLDQLDREGLGK